MQRGLIVLVVLAGCLASPATPSVQGQVKQPAKELLPHHGIWKLEMDTKVDLPSRGVRR
jgi:hypothetical protein